MTDPYQVLGVNRSASDEEIKKAYRSLSRRYHPDANINNPNRAQAEERFKEVQQAYDQIMREKQSGTGGYHSTEGYSRSYSNAAGSATSENPRMQAAANYIRNRYYREAFHVLNDIPFSERNGLWYYYSSMANQGVGNTATAIEHINRAVELEPSNTLYRQYQQYVNGGGTWYSTMGSSYERPYYSMGSFCWSFFILQLFCSCCCRPI